MTKISAISACGLVFAALAGGCSSDASDDGGSSGGEDPTTDGGHQPVDGEGSSGAEADSADEGTDAADGDTDGGTDTGLPQGCGEQDICAAPATDLALSFTVGEGQGMLVALDDQRVFFVAGESTRQVVGVTDGTAVGTTVLYRDAAPWPVDGVEYDGRVIARWDRDRLGNAFYAVDPDSGAATALTPLGSEPLRSFVGSDGLVLRTEDAVYTSDGTPAGTQILFATSPEDVDFQTGDLCGFGSRAALFVLDETNDNVALYTSTGAGPAELLGSLPTSGSFAPLCTHTTTMQDGSFWFYRQVGAQREIWSAAVGQPPMAVFAPAVLQGGNETPTDFAGSGPSLFFRYRPAGESGFRLFRTDGTERGTSQVWSPTNAGDTVIGSGGAALARPTNVLSDGDTGVWFRATHPRSGLAVLWHHNGDFAAPVETGLSADSPSASQYNGSAPMAVFEQRLYAGGSPHTVEIEDTEMRRFGLLGTDGTRSDGLNFFAKSGVRVWLGMVDGLYYSDRP